MIKWKYYPTSSVSKEPIGTLYALNEEQAYDIASTRKNLALEQFKRLFVISTFENGI